MLSSVYLIILKSPSKHHGSLHKPLIAANSSQNCVLSTLNTSPYTLVKHQTLFSSSCTNMHEMVKMSSNFSINSSSLLSHTNQIPPSEPVASSACHLIFLHGLILLTSAPNFVSYRQISSGLCRHIIDFSIFFFPSSPNPLTFQDKTFIFINNPVLKLNHSFVCPFFLIIHKALKFLISLSNFISVGLVFSPGFVSTPLTPLPFMSVINLISLRGYPFVGIHIMLVKISNSLNTYTPVSS